MRSATNTSQNAPVFPAAPGRPVYVLISAKDDAAGLAISERFTRTDPRS